MREGHVDDRNRVVVPNYSRYLRFPAQPAIRELDDEGMTLTRFAGTCEK